MILVQYYKPVKIYVFDKINSETYTSTAMRDKFGIIQFYKTGGREWFSKWNNGISRTIVAGNWDRYDSEFKATGDAHIDIDGSGIARMTGSVPRMFVYDQTEAKKWLNVEITYYVRVNNISKAEPYHGISAGTRSNHHNTGTELTRCNARTYYGKALFTSGDTEFYKEFSHASYEVGASTSRRGLFGSYMPENKWHGFKFIVRNVDNDEHVKLELWYDDSNGLNGGNWRKVNEYNDNADGTLFTSNDCYQPPAIFNASGVASIFRIDGMTDGKYVEWKWVSIREISED